jgi:hypothetical protein
MAFRKRSISALSMSSSMPHLTADASFESGVLWACSDAGVTLFFKCSRILWVT